MTPPPSTAATDERLRTARVSRWRVRRADFFKVRSPHERQGTPASLMSPAVDVQDGLNSRAPGGGAASVESPDLGRTKGGGASLSLVPKAATVHFVVPDG